MADENWMTIRCPMSCITHLEEFHERNIPTSRLVNYLHPRTQSCRTRERNPSVHCNLHSISGISFNTTYMLHSMTMQLQSQYECGVKRPFWRMLDTLLFPFPAFRSKFPSPSFCLRLRCQWLSVDVRRRVHHQLLWGSTRSRFHMLVLDEFNYWRARNLFSCFGLVEEWLWRGLCAIECDYWYCHYHYSSERVPTAVSEERERVLIYHFSWLYYQYRIWVYVCLRRSWIFKYRRKRTVIKAERRIT